MIEVVRQKKLDGFGRQRANFNTKARRDEGSLTACPRCSDAAFSVPLKPRRWCGSAIKMGYVVGRDAMQSGQGFLAMPSIFESAGLDSTAVPCESGSGSRILPRSLNNIER